MMTVFLLAVFYNSTEIVAWSQQQLNLYVDCRPLLVLTLYPD